MKEATASEPTSRIMEKEALLAKENRLLREVCEYQEKRITELLDERDAFKLYPRGLFHNVQVKYT